MKDNCINCESTIKGVQLLAAELVDHPEVLLIKKSCSDANQTSIEDRLTKLSQDLYLLLQSESITNKINNQSRDHRNTIKRNERTCRQIPLHTSGLDTEQIWIQIDTLTQPLLRYLSHNVKMFHSQQKENDQFITLCQPFETQPADFNSIDQTLIDQTESSLMNSDDTDINSELEDTLMDSDNDSIPDGNDEETQKSTVDFFSKKDMEKFADCQDDQAYHLNTEHPTDDDDVKEEELEKLLDGFIEGIGDDRLGKLGMEDNDSTSDEYEEKDDTYYKNKFNKTQSENSEDDDAMQEEDDDAMQEEDDAIFMNPKKLINASSDNGHLTKKIKPQKSVLLELTQKDQELNDTVDAIEQELVSGKHWSLMGEVSASQRSNNSLLELNLDLPNYSHSSAKQSFPDHLSTSIMDEDDIESAMTSMKSTGFKMSQLSITIETLVKQRIKDILFDDVERKFEVPPSQKNTSSPEEALETLDFKRNRIGLADIYADKYAKELLGGQTTDEKLLDKNIAAITRLFANVMYKLDALTHQRSLTKPSKQDATDLGDIAAITVEDTIPATLADSQRKAPEEIMAPEHEKQYGEMSQEEKRAIRSLKKDRRRKTIKGKLISGEVTMRDAIQRNLHLQEKNKLAKQDAKLKKMTGSSNQPHKMNYITSGKRFKSNNLIADVTDSERLRLAA